MSDNSNKTESFETRAMRQQFNGIKKNGLGLYDKDAPLLLKGNLVNNPEGKVVFEEDENGTWNMAANGSISFING